MWNSAALIAVYFTECLKFSVILNFEPFKMETLLLGGKRKAKDDHSTYMQNQKQYA